MSNEPTEVTPTWRAAVTAAAKAAGHNLTPDAVNEFAQTLGMDPLNRFYSLYADNVPQAVVAEAVKAAFAASPPKPEQVAGAFDATCGIPPEIWEKLSPVNRLAKAREWEAQKGKAAAPDSQQPTTPDFRIRRLKSELHGASLRLHSLRGEAREEAAKRVLALQTQLKDAMKA